MLEIEKVFVRKNSLEKNCFARINYRPVSVLPSFIKILERIIHDRLYTYVTENKIVSEKQFGFRAGHSGDHALD